jgi:hypothetical protein
MKLKLGFCCVKSMKPDTTRVLYYFFKKQILAQQPFLVRAFPFGISRQICFFYEVGLSDQCPQPLLHEEKTLTYPGFEPGTFGFQVGNATN